MSNQTKLTPASGLYGGATENKSSEYAAAAEPTMANVIETDTDGLIAGEMMIDTVEGEMLIYRAMPSTGGPFALILVIQEIFGVHEHIRDICRRLAKLGYLAVAPDLYGRQGDPSKYSNPKEILTKIVAHVPTRQVMSDLDTTVSWFCKEGVADKQRLGITGYCWGGGVVWHYAAHNPGLKAGVAWYGRLEGSRTELQPRQVLDLADKLQAPVLGLYGGMDTGIPLASVERMQAALRSSEEVSNIVVYPDAHHGFFADYRASYDPIIAKEAWQRMLDWLQHFGVHA